MHTRVRVALGGALAAVTAVGALGVPATAGPDAVGEAGGIVGREPASAPTEGSLLTLITGEQALVSTGDGAPSAQLVTGGYSTFTRNGDVYLYPDSAVEALKDGRVDEELFNVSAIVRAGWDDANRDTIPVIAEFEAGTAPRAAVPGAEETIPLESLGGAAIETAKEDASAFWEAFTEGRGAAGQIERLSLDSPVSASLDRSVAQIGAPEAWAAGYDGTGVTVAVLDSGIDADHPDLAGQITAEVDFTGAGTIEDYHGHGTHVASTVLGTGARNSERAGVAPGAGLLVGKVLNSVGNGQESWIIAGMEWAVEQGADVVNMSLGSNVMTDCTDPMALAAQELSDDALFVVAAGNAGLRETVSSPGCADGVLTVGAVDRDLATASFSSRGPTMAEEHGVKPDLAAPGVGIVAADAGMPGDVPYVAMSGTSMAAPHVAGAAALLAQAEPDLTAQELKDRLISSSRPGATGSVYEQGAGVVDVPRALDQAVIGQGTTHLGSFDWPHSSSDRVTRDLTYTNTGDRPVTLRLELEDVTGQDGGRVPGGLLRLQDQRVTVPAHGTATARVVVNPGVRVKAEEYGEIGGRVVASGPGGLTVTTPVGLWLGPDTVTLTVKVLDRRGDPATGTSVLDIVDMDSDSGLRQYVDGAEAITAEVRPGSYSLSAFIPTYDAGTAGGVGVPIESMTYAGEPELQVRRDTTVVLDARDGARYEVRDARELEVRAGAVSYARTWDRFLMAGSIATDRLVDDYYAVPTTKVRDGDFTLDTLWRAYAPALRLQVQGGELIDAEAAGLSGALDGTGVSELVDLGATADPGFTDGLARAAGRIGLVRVSEIFEIGTVLRAAGAYGVTALVFDQDVPGRLSYNPLFGQPVPTPGITITREAGDALRSRLATGPVHLEWTGVPVSPYVYNLALTSEDRIPDRLVFQAGDDDLATVSEQWTAQRQAGTFYDVMSVVRPYGRVFLGTMQTVAAPQTRSVYYTPGAFWAPMSASALIFTEILAGVPTSYEAGEQDSTAWYRQPVVTGLNLSADDFSPAHVGERQGNLMGVAFPHYRDADGHYTYGTGFGDLGNASLWEDGVHLGDSAWPAGQWTVSTGPADYELRVMTGKLIGGGAQSPNWRMSQFTTTWFEFTSQRPADDDEVAVLPLLIPYYDLPLDEYNLAAAEAGFEVTVRGEGQADYDAGEIVSARVWTSTDSGTTWVEAPVEARGDAHVATVDNSGAAGAYVWLKVELVDEHGATVTQEVTKAYGVR